MRKLQFIPPTDATAVESAVEDVQFIPPTDATAVEEITDPDVKKKESAEPTVSTNGSKDLQATQELPSIPSQPLAGLGGGTVKEKAGAEQLGVTHSFSGKAQELADLTQAKRVSGAGGTWVTKEDAAPIIGYEENQKALSDIDKQISNNQQQGRFIDPTRQKRLKELQAERDILAKRSDQLISETNKDVSGIISKGIGDDWEDFTNELGDIDVSKIGDFARQEALKYGVPEDGYFFERVKNAAKSKVELEKISPTVDSFFLGGERRSPEGIRRRKEVQLPGYDSPSTVLMSSYGPYTIDGKHAAFPTLFPKDPKRQTSDPNDWIVAENDDEAYRIAKERGEVLYFDTQEEADAMAEGSWKKRKGTYEEMYGVKPEDDAESMLSREDLRKSLGLSKLDAEFSSQMAQLNSDIYRSSTEDIERISEERYGQPIEDYVSQLGQGYESESKAIESRYSSLIQDGNFVGSQDQYDAYQKELQSVKSGYESQFNDIVSQNMRDVAAVNNKANRRFNRQRDEIVQAYKTEYQDKAKGINNVLQERYQKAYNKALDKAMEVENVKKESRAMLTGSFMGGLGASGIIAGASGQMSSIFRSMGMKEGAEFFEQAAVNFDIGDTEIKGWKDILDPIKLVKSTSFTLGGMAPMLVVSTGVGMVTGGVGGGAMLTTLAAGTAGWGVETMSITQDAYDQKFKETGSVAKAEDAANKSFNGQVMLMPMYALGMAPFFGNIGGKLAKIGMNNAPSRFIAGGVMETVSELGQEYPQQLFEQAIADDKELSAAFDYASVEGFKSTVLNVAPTTFLLGGGGAATQKGETSKEDMAKALAMKVNIGELTETAMEQNMLAMTVNAGEKFSKAFVATQLMEGNITEEQAERATSAIESSVATIEKGKEYNLDNKNNYILATLNLKLKAAKAKAESESDPMMKGIAERKVKKIEKQAQQLMETGNVDVALVTYPDGSFDILTHDEARIAMSKDEFMESFSSGDLKVEAMGESQAKLMSELQEKAKAMEPEAAPVEEKPIPRVFETPTDEKYAVVNEGKGEGDRVLTKTEYDEYVAPVDERQKIEEKERGFFGKILDKVFKDKKIDEDVQLTEEQKEQGIQELYDRRVKQTEDNIKEYQETGNTIIENDYREDLEILKSESPRQYLERDLEGLKGMPNYYSEKASKKDALRYNKQVVQESVDKIYRVEKLLGITATEQEVKARQDIIDSTPTQAELEAQQETVPAETIEVVEEDKKADIESRKKALIDIMEATGDDTFIIGVADGTFAGDGLLNMNENGDVVLTRFADSEEGLNKSGGITSPDELKNLINNFGGEQIPTSAIEGGMVAYQEAGGGVVGEYHIPLNDLIQLIKDGYIVFAGLGNKEFVLSPHIADKYLTKINGETKQDAIQEPSTEAVDVQEPTAKEETAPVVAESTPVEETVLQEEEEVESTTDEDLDAIDRELSDQGVVEGALTGRSRRRRVVKAVRNGIKAISKALPNVTIKLYETQAEFEEATGKKGNGYYNFKEKSISINLDTANARTVAHEIFHAFLLDKISTNKEAASISAKLLLELNKVEGNNAKLVKELSDFASMYEEEGIGVMTEEMLAEYLGKVAENYDSLSARGKRAVREFVNSMLELIGKANPETKEFLPSRVSGNEVVDMLVGIGERVAAGEVIETEQIEGLFTPEITVEVSEATKATDREQLNPEEVKSKNVKGKKVGKGLSVKQVKGEKVKEGIDNISVKKAREASPNLYIKNANILKDYDVVKGVNKFREIKSLKQADEVYDIFVNEVSENLIYLHDKFNQDLLDYATLWYDGANQIAQEFASKFDISLEQAAGIIAAQSPQKDWYQNVRLAEMVLEQFKSNPVFTQEALDFQKEINERGYKDKSGDKLRKARERGDKLIAALESFVGQNLNDIPDAFKPYVVRTTQEISGSKDYDVISPDGRRVGLAKKNDGSNAKVAWGSYTEIGKSVAIYLNGSEKNISDQLGVYHKIRNFFNNISDPMSEDNDVTMDTHAVAAALLKPLSGKSKQVAQNFGTGTSNSGPLGLKGVYYAFADAYVKAAKEKGILPREMQSITWEAARGLFTDSYKNNKANVKEVNDIFKDYTNGKITKDEAREKVLEAAGGVNDPTWAGPILSELGKDSKKKADTGRLPGDERGGKRSEAKPRDRGRDTGDVSGVTGRDQKVKVDKSTIKKNVVAAVEFIKKAALKAEDGVTLNIDGTRYDGGGLVVPIASINIDQGAINPSSVADFVERNKGKLSNDTFKLGLYKFPEESTVSIDLSVIVPNKNRKLAISVGKKLNQESLFDLDSGENIKTGGTGQNTVELTDEQAAELATSLSENKEPEFLGRESKTKEKKRGFLGRNIEKLKFASSLSESVFEDPEAFYEPQVLAEIKENAKYMSDSELIEAMSLDGLNSIMNISGSNNTNMAVLAAAELINRKLAAGQDVGSVVLQLNKMGTTIGQLMRQFGELKKSTPAGYMLAIERLAENNNIKLKDIDKKKISKLLQAKTDIIKDLNEATEKRIDPNLPLDEQKKLDKEIKKISNELYKVDSELNRFVQTKIPLKMTDTLIQIMQGNLLTTASLAVNILGNLSQLSIIFPIKAIGATFDSLRRFLLGGERTTSFSIPAYWYGAKSFAKTLPDAARILFWKGPRDDFNDMLKGEINNGLLGLRAWMVLMSKGGIPEPAKMSGFDKMLSMVSKKTGEKKIGAKANIALNLIIQGTFGVTADIMFRALQAGDVIFKRPYRDMSLYEIGKRKGLSGERLESLLKYPSKKELQMAEEIAKEGTFQEDSALAKSSKLMTDAMVKAAETLGGKVFAKNIGKLLARSQFPYVKTPANIASFTFKMNVPAIAFIASLKYLSQGNNRKAALNFGIGVTGSMISTVAIGLVGNGLIQSMGDDDDPRERALKYSTFPPGTINKSALMRVLDYIKEGYNKGGSSEMGERLRQFYVGEIPEEITVPRSGEDEFMSYLKLGIPGFVMGVYAMEDKDTAKNKAVNPATESFVESMMGGTLKIPQSIKFISQQSFLQGTSALLNALTGSEYETDRWLTNTFRAVSSIPLPNQLASIARAQRNYLPDYRDEDLSIQFKNVMDDKIFFLRKETPSNQIRVDLWGRKIAQTPEGADPYMYHLGLDPLRNTTAREDNLSFEIYELYKRTGDAKSIPSMVDDNFLHTYKGEKRRFNMTVAETNRLQGIVGSVRQINAQKLVESPRWQAMDDEQRIDKLSSIYRDATKNSLVEEEKKIIAYNIALGLSEDKD
jgi:SHS2 domain-containing protein